jgi:hypothetical protein
VKILSLFLASALVGGGAVSALAAEPLVRADVPFAFEAGTTKLPAGEYEILASEEPPQGVLTVRNVKTDHEVFVETLTRLAEREGDSSALVFDVLGGERILSEVHVAGEDGYLLPAAGKQPHRHETVKAKTTRKAGKP